MPLPDFNIKKCILMYPHTHGKIYAEIHGKNANMPTQGQKEIAMMNFRQYCLAYWFTAENAESAYYFAIKHVAKSLEMISGINLVDDDKENPCRKEILLYKDRSVKPLNLKRKILLNGFVNKSLILFTDLNKSNK